MKDKIKYISRDDEEISLFGEHFSEMREYLKYKYKS